MVGSLAKNEFEIGARLGICFAFTGGSSCLEFRQRLTPFSQDSAVS